MNGWYMNGLISLTELSEEQIENGATFELPKNSITSWDGNRACLQIGLCFYFLKYVDTFQWRYCGETHNIQKAWKYLTTGQIDESE